MEERSRIEALAEAGMKVVSENSERSERLEAMENATISAIALEAMEIIGEQGYHALDIDKVIAEGRCELGIDPSSGIGLNELEHLTEFMGTDEFSGLVMDVVDVCHNVAHVLEISGNWAEILVKEAQDIEDINCLMTNYILTDIEESEVPERYKEERFFDMVNKRIEEWTMLSHQITKRIFKLSTSAKNSRIINIVDVMTDSLNTQLEVVNTVNLYNTYAARFDQLINTAIMVISRAM